jgi:hypothetical protein
MFLYNQVKDKDQNVNKISLHPLSTGCGKNPDESKKVRENFSRTYLLCPFYKWHVYVSLPLAQDVLIVNYIPSTYIYHRNLLPASVN